MTPLRVLLIDDENFCNTLKMYLELQFKGLPLHIDTCRRFHEAKEKVMAMHQPSSAYDLVFLDLRLESREPLAYRQSDDASIYEGIELLNLLVEIDPEGTQIKRAVLTGTPNYEAARRLKYSFDNARAAVFSKEIEPTPGYQTVELPFPENVIRHILSVGQQSGKWSES